jgi:prevent-host-death family protein
METISIKTLRDHFGTYIAKARAGERIIITDRGEEIAELGPLSPARQAVQALAQRGKLQWNGTKPSGLSGIKIQGGSVAETVLEERQ